MPSNWCTREARPCSGSRRDQRGHAEFIGLDDDAIQQICEQASEGDLLKAVNFNCPGQMRHQGDKAACHRPKTWRQRPGR